MAATSTTAPPDPAPKGRVSSLANKVILNSGAQAGRQVFIAVVGILSVALVSRYLSVEDYGEIVAALVIVSLFAVAGDFGITATTAREMAKAPDEEHRDHLAAAAFWTWTAFSLLTAVLILGISYVAYSDTLTRESVVIILVSTTVLAPFAGVAQAVAITEQRVWKLAIGATIARSLALAVIVATIVLDLGPLAIAFAFGIGFLFDSAFGILLVRPRIPLRHPDFSHINPLVVSALPLGLVLVVNSLYFKLDAFLLTLMGSSTDVAIYGIAYRAFDILIVIPGFVMVALLPVLSRMKPDDPQFTRIVQKAFTTMMLITIPLFGFALLGDEAMTFLGGSQYTSGGFVLGFVLAGVAIGCMNGVFGNTLVTQGKQAVLLKVALLNLSLNALMNVIAIPIWGARGAAVALSISEVTSLLCTMYVYSKIAPLPRLPMPVRTAAALIAMIVAMSVRYLVSDNEIVRLVVAIAVGLPTYVGTLALLGAIPPYIKEPLAAGLASVKRRLARPRPAHSAK